MTRTIQDIVVSVVAIGGFAFCVYLGFRYFRGWTIQYAITDSSIRVRLYGVTVVSMHFEDVELCRVIRASTLWKPWNPLLFTAVWLHTKHFADGLVLKKKKGYLKYIITPSQPEQIAEAVKAVQSKEKGSS
jgi:hypothetical protein